MNGHSTVAESDIHIINLKTKEIMATKTVEMMETGKYPLNPNAKDTLDLVVTGVSERVGRDCVNFVAGLRSEVQPDVANALWYFSTAMKMLPEELRNVRGTAWALMVLIKEQTFNKEFKY